MCYHIGETHVLWFMKWKHHSWVTSKYMSHLPLTDLPDFRHFFSLFSINYWITCMSKQKTVFNCNQYGNLLCGFSELPKWLLHAFTRLFMHPKHDLPRDGSTCFGTEAMNARINTQNKTWYQYYWYILGIDPSTWSYYLQPAVCCFSGVALLSPHSSRLNSFQRRE